MKITTLIVAAFCSALMLTQPAVAKKSREQQHIKAYNAQAKKWALHLTKVRADIVKINSDIKKAGKKAKSGTKAQKAAAATRIIKELTPKLMIHHACYSGFVEDSKPVMTHQGPAVNWVQTKNLKNAIRDHGKCIKTLTLKSQGGCKKTSKQLSDECNPKCRPKFNLYQTCMTKCIRNCGG